MSTKSRSLKQDLGQKFIALFTILTVIIGLSPFSGLSVAVASHGTGDDPALSITSINGETPGSYSCDENPLFNPISISGSGVGSAPPGRVEQYAVQVDWGDGTVDDTVVSDFIPSSGNHVNFTFTFSAGAHVYTTDGERVITARLYHQTPPGNDSQADSVASITICVDIDPPTTGTLTVEKVVVDSETGADNFSFSINEGDSVEFESDGNNEIQLETGPYSVVEDDLGSDWEVSYSEACEGSIEPGDTVTCTITNTFISPDEASITIVKNAVPNNSQDFSFIGDLGDFELDDDSNETLANSKSFVVSPGTYSVEEVLPEFGWKLYEATCDNGDDPSEITVEAGDSVTCTFENHKLATIVIVKSAIGGDGTFEFSTAGGDNLPADFEIFTEDGSGSQTFEEIDPDLEYSVSEVGVPDEGWELTGAECTGTNTPDSITPNNGEVVTCTFTNTFEDAEPLGIMIIVKKIIFGGDLGFSAFSFQINGGSETPFDAEDGQNEFSEEAGGYTISEVVIDDYTTTYSNDLNEEANCDGLVVPDGTTVTCVITNEFTGGGEDLTQCSDGIDNDEDGLTDLDDPGCSSSEDDDETDEAGGGGGSSNPPQCSDGIDNDGDGFVDYPDDPQCANPNNTTEGSSGGGGTGGGGNSGPSVLGASSGQVLGASTCNDLLLREYIGGNSYGRNSEEIMKLQNFLNGELNLALEINGVYDAATIAAVNQFQLKYWAIILLPWQPFGQDPHTPTGITYKMTRFWANFLNCPTALNPYPVLP